ncbi:ATP synthase delta chain, chloroplastic [Heracleum sosnowskyi]|uniref:ATP synthase delta chain, chloroplastic n=1 Tax=Heracleum sosnowskyi TaxID=360622 RepID=A0AAD8J3J6_9APIA|nr:ATP synthase delta chain, chloroplastic [Heracleum sosnowskyi]
MATLQQTPITFQCRSPCAQYTPPKAHTLSFSGGLRLPKLTLNVKSRRRGGAKMSDSVASSYANALADVAQSNGTLEATAADLEKVNQLFSEEAVFKYFINPTVSVEDKNNLVDAYTKEANLQPHIANFLNILIDMKRIDEIKEIAKEFEVTYNKMTETELAVVTSVVQLDEANLAQIGKGVQKLTGAKNVKIKTAIDESLVAGFTIRYGNGGSKLIDMSVKKQLEEIAETLEVGDIQLVG